MAGIEEISVSTVSDISRRMKYYCVMKCSYQEGIWEEVMGCKMSWSSSGGTEEEREKPNSECPVCILNSSIVPCEFPLSHAIVARYASTL